MKSWSGVNTWNISISMGCKSVIMKKYSLCFIFKYFVLHVKYELTDETDEKINC